MYKGNDSPRETEILFGPQSTDPIVLKQEDIQNLFAVMWQYSEYSDQLGREREMYIVGYYADIPGSVVVVYRGSFLSEAELTYEALCTVMRRMRTARRLTENEARELTRERTIVKDRTF